MDKNRKNSNKYHKDLGKILLNLYQTVPDRIGSLRAFFICHIQVIDDCVFFKYLVPRGEAYDKKYKEKLREDDTEPSYHLSAASSSRQSKK